MVPALKEGIEMSSFVSSRIIPNYPTINACRLHHHHIYTVISALFFRHNVRYCNEIDDIDRHNSCMLIWGTREDKEEFFDFGVRHNIPIIVIEDGFIRSITLGELQSVPSSICFDDMGIYFDSTKKSRLQNLIETMDVEDEYPGITDRARRCIEYIKKHRISKYNFAPHIPTDRLYGKKERERVLVIGQVEDDESILKGCSKRMTNNDLVRAAFDENPNSEIIYKIHPVVLNKFRSKMSDPDEVRDISTILTEHTSIDSALKTIDSLYTMSSLVGFEALIRDIPVTCFGAPFYSGWGLTDDRDPRAIKRKGNLQGRMTIEELFALSYIVYPEYIDQKTFERREIEDILETIAGAWDGKGELERGVIDNSEKQHPFIGFYKRVVSAPHFLKRTPLFRMLKGLNRIEKKVKLKKEAQELKVRLLLDRFTPQGHAINDYADNKGVGRDGGKGVNEVGLEARYEFVKGFFPDSGKGVKILNVGSGAGRGSSILSEVSGSHITHCNITAKSPSSSVIDEAVEKYPGDNLDFECIDILENTKFEKSTGRRFDVITALNFMEYIPDCERVFRELKGAIRRGGILFGSTPNAREVILEEPLHFRYYIREEIEAILKRSGWKIVDFYGQSNLLRGGEVCEYTDDSPTVIFIAKRPFLSF